MNMPRRKVIVYDLLIFVVSLIIIVIMAAPSRNILSTIRSGSDDEQIQSLSARINEVSGNEKFWHDAYLWFIGAAILVSVVLFFVQHHEASLAKERADAESELNRVKDRKLTREISAADERAGKANERAAALESETAQSRVLIANAQADAAKATERAALAESHLAESNAQAKLAERHAKEADVKAEGFRLDIAKANERAAEANRIAEQEKLARLQLEARLADRTLTTAQQSAIASRLAPFSGTVVDAAIWGDTPEIQIISSQLLDAIRKAGWVIQPGQAMGGGAVRGILVGTSPAADENTVRAATALVASIQEAGLAGGSWPFDQLRTPNAMMNSGFTGTAPIRLFIGSKP